MKAAVVLLVLFVCVVGFSEAEKKRKRTKDNGAGEICSLKKPKTIYDCNCYCKKSSYTRQFTKPCEDFAPRRRRKNCKRCRLMLSFFKSKSTATPF